MSYFCDPSDLPSRPVVSAGDKDLIGARSVGLTGHKGEYNKGNDCHLSRE